MNGSECRTLVLASHTADKLERCISYQVVSVMLRARGSFFIEMRCP